MHRKNTDRLLHSTLVASALALAPAAAWGDDIPAAGQPGFEERELERIDPQRFRPQPALDLDIPEVEPMEDVPHAEFDVERYSFRGNTVFHDSELAELMADYRGTITFEELLEGADRITSAYRERGYIVARAYVPEQTIEDGTVEIAVLEGALGELQFTGDEPITTERMAQRFDRLAADGRINQGDLERGALLLNDLPGMSAGINLRPGEEVGTTDVVVEARDEGTFDFSVDYNNFGAEVTGEHRFGAQLGINNLFGVGDRFSFRPIVSDTGDTFYGSLGFDMPMFTPATRVGIRGSYLQSELGEEFEDLEIENTATTGELYATHTFVRTRDFTWSMRFGYENRQFERTFDADFSDREIEVADYSLDVIDLGTTIDTRDRLWGGGMTSYYVNLRHGLSEVDEEGGDVVPGEARIDGEFTSLLAGAQRLQALPGNWSVMAEVDGQYSGDNLDTSERMSLGGPNAVRAYRPSEALGDSGLIGRSELRYNLSEAVADVGWIGRLEVFGLLDGGVTQLNADPDVAGQEDEISFTRSAWGAGVRLSRADQYYIDFTVANRLGDQESNVDQPDDDETQFWAQAVYWF